MGGRRGSGPSCVSLARLSRTATITAKTGKELWVTKLKAVGNVNPISYRVRNGKQYVAIVATDQVVVFALP